MLFDQSEFDVRCEWGEHGIAELAPISDAIIIVDVLSFSTCVSIAVSRGATIFPFRWKDAVAARAYAASVGAELAASRSMREQSGSPYSLSPTSLLNIPQGARLVLPSPNGSMLTLSTGTTPTFAGCLRNCEAVARAAMQCGRRVAVIPAGERWVPDGTLRPAVEDWVGAGAIIQYFDGAPSPEARAALAAYRGTEDALGSLLTECGSGKQLIAMGYPQDLGVCAALNADPVAAMLQDGAYMASQP